MLRTLSAQGTFFGEILPPMHSYVTLLFRRYGAPFCAYRIPSDAGDLPCGGIRFMSLFRTLMSRFSRGRALAPTSLNSRVTSPLGCAPHAQCRLRCSPAVPSLRFHLPRISSASQSTILCALRTNAPRALREGSSTGGWGQATRTPLEAAFKRPGGVISPSH